MGLFVTLDCGHPQILLEVGDPAAAGPVPACLYPIDTGTSIDPGDEMTCITCDQIRTVRTAT